VSDGRGEYTLVIAPPPTTPAYPEVPAAESISSEFGQLIEIQGTSRRSAIKQLALKYGLSARAVYSLVEKGR
jgi:hypothetical protein